MIRHNSASLQAARRSLERTINRFDEFIQPVTEVEILETLRALAATFQLTVPDAVGLELYVAALRTIPRPVFVEARKQLVLHHKYAKLPYPADFVIAGAFEASCISAVDTVLRTNLRRVEQTLYLLREGMY